MAEQAAKDRIIGHMNKDHAVSVMDYVAVHEKIPRESIVAGRMTSISNDGMDIEYTLKNKGSKSVFIRFDPPMKSLGEAREVLVNMAKDCASKLGYSPFTIKKYVYPNTVGTVALLSVVVLFHVLYFNRIYIFTDLTSPLVKFLSSLTGVDNVVERMEKSVLYRYMTHLLLSMYVVHVLEAASYWKLVKKYRTPAPQKYYWLLSFLIEGKGGISRYETLVDEIENPKKH